MSMFGALYQLARTMRPRQWLKNLSVFSAPMFLGTLFLPKIFIRTFDAFLVFCLVSSGTYILNDIIDAKSDRQHPIKKNRPIASGKLSVYLALAAVLIFWGGSLWYSFIHIGTFFSYSVIFYIIVQLFYSLYLRNIIILDSLTVATGFVIRVFAGGLASESSISSWLALATIALSLLLAFGKRRSEKTILAKHMAELGQKIPSAQTRKTLMHYPDTLLDSMISTSASFCIITYALFTFQVSPQELNRDLYHLLPSILRTPKWFMLTIPLVIYGVARYLYVIYEKEEGESPERVLLSDTPLLLTVVVWGLSVLTIVYFLPLVSIR